MNKDMTAEEAKAAVALTMVAAEAEAERRFPDSRFTDPLQGATIRAVFVEGFVKGCRFGVFN